MLMTDFQPHWAEWLLLALLAVLLPYRTAFHTLPKVRALPPHEIERIRPAVYGQAVIAQWLFAGTGLYLVLFRGVSWAELGLTVRSDGMLQGVVLLVGLGVILLYMRRRVMRSVDGAMMVREAFERVEWLLPRTPGQRRAWWVVSAHAGWGEELFYRGFALIMLSTVMPFWMAGVVSTLMFGFAHIYQGARGIVLTSILGAVFLGLYVVSGSLVIPILAHAMYDIYAGELGYWALKNKHTNGSPQESQAENQETGADN
jgi:uncharacterized protein